MEITNNAIIYIYVYNNISILHILKALSLIIHFQNIKILRSPSRDFRDVSMFFGMGSVYRTYSLILIIINFKHGQTHQ